jgi:dTDP-4-dehydrorhamnose 3,5-epimerase
VKFTPGQLTGPTLIKLETASDERGYFARTWCLNEFAENHIIYDFIQDSISVNLKKATLRGMHLQTAPYSEAKLIRCTHGAIYDVILDLREDSPTYLK